MKGILLHGGHGTRLRPLTHTGPKQLLPIANKPMSEYCIESMKDAGVTEIAIIIGGIGSNKVREYYGDGEKFDVKITYVKQDEPLGISHAINLCSSFIGDDKFLVFLGDNIIQKNIYNFANEFLKSKEIDFLTKHNSLFIADISSMPSFVTKLFALPKMRKYNYNVLLIYDEDEKRFIKKEGKLTVYKIDNGVIKSINFINSQEELKSLF